MSTSRRQFDPDIVRAAMEIVQGVLTEFPRGTWFGLQTEVSDAVSEIDRLAAFLGRSLAGDRAQDERRHATRVISQEDVVIAVVQLPD